ncbi:hypothetical protein GWK47_004756 [Chionoecetes opilio]|uniref:Uncharacterized protein n=1 Tax=Chionoecetes opilio TaxID=41210 RepID=A0A8J5CYC4_CHIOP|nr:hypothetical protein GWK47_004756 [Chionoecetes opilio]
MRLFDGLFKSFKSVRTFAMTTGLVNLSIFLGGALPGGNSFPFLLEQTPGPMDFKSPHSFKIFGCSGAPFRLRKRRAWAPAGCLFVVRVYAKGLVEASFSVQAPRLDLNSSRGPRDPPTIDPESSVARRNCQTTVVVSKNFWAVLLRPDVSCEPKKAMG